MNREAYLEGVKLAMEDAGLLKEAGLKKRILYFLREPAAKVLKALSPKTRQYLAEAEVLKNEFLRAQELQEKYKDILRSPTNPIGKYLHPLPLVRTEDVPYRIQRAAGIAYGRWRKNLIKEIETRKEIEKLIAKSSPTQRYLSDLEATINPFSKFPVPWWG